jgi:hypothetical protein
MAALLGGLSGCGASDPRTRPNPLSEKIAATEALIAVVKAIRDDTSAVAAMPQLRKAVAQVRQAGREFNALMRAAPAEAKQLVEMYGLDFVGAQVRLQAAVAKAWRAAPGRKKQITKLLQNKQTLEQ